MFELLHSKSIIRSSEQIDSQGDSVSSDSARVILASPVSFVDLGGICRLAKLLLSEAAFRRAFDVDFSEDTSFSVGVSTSD